MTWRTYDCNGQSISRKGPPQGENHLGVILSVATRSVAKSKDAPR